MPRDGTRQGTPGRSYPNRSDLRQTVAPPDTPAPDEHGQKVRRERQMQALPPGPPPNRLAGPSTRPNEPVQAGLPIGPGPGASGVAAMSRSDRVLTRLQALVQVSGDPQLAAMVGRVQAARRRG